jgi:hydroxypyruvate isomerase
MKRREVMAAMAVAPLLSAGTARAQIGPSSDAGRTAGRLKLGVMFQVWGWPTAVITDLEQRFSILSRLGYAAVDLLSADQVPLAREHGLEPCLMTAPGGTSQAVGAIRATPEQFEATRAGIEMCADVRCPNLLILPGELRGMSREEGADKLIDFFSRLAPEAEARGINVCMEPTNNRVASDDRTDTIFNHLDWGLSVLRAVNSPNIKLLYDFYHTQIMDGDVTSRLLENLDSVCHIQVAGVPGRGVIDDSQELDYRYIARRIAESGYTGYVSLEHYPRAGEDLEELLERSYAILNG